MKLKYYLTAEGKKVYTLKESNGQDAHYKFIKIKPAKTVSPGSQDPE